ncbi:MAG: phage integrase SAM-like domain-containing protein [Mangrovibacterium sp.]
MSRILTIEHPEQNNDRLRGKNVSLCALLDTQHPNKNNTFTVRIRIIHERKPKYFTTKVKVTEEQFTAIATGNPRGKLKETKITLFQLLKKANDLILSEDQFEFKAFEKAFFGKPGADNNVFDRYQDAINCYKENGQIGTASSYTCSANSLLSFTLYLNNGRDVSLTFQDVTVTWLNRYERFMTGAGKSVTSVGIYLRPLRALFKIAISDKTIKPELYPFGKGKYEIPAPKSVKKALNKEQLKQLFDAVPANGYQQKAKDFWFFLFNTSGMNVKDLIRLKYKYISGDKLVYVREKTKRTTKAKQTPVVVYLNDYAVRFIETYGNPDKSPDNYIFDIVSQGMSDEEIFRKSGLFTRFINDQIKSLAKTNGLPVEISSYWSRHSFATNAIRNGASLEQIRQALNHHNLATTEGYFAGFEDDTMKQIADNLMNFK